MHASIAEFPSKELYSSALISHESVASRRLIDLPSIIDKDSEDAQDVLEPTLVFFDTAGTEMYERLEGDEVDSNVNKTSVGEGSRYNENEAEIVSKWVRQLVSINRNTSRKAADQFPQISHGVPEAEIAIITPYQAQVAHLSSLLRDDFPGLVCGSVDGMQGQEREVSGTM
jgi:DNA polymerase alpha-associated DNA helicase A